MRLPFATWPIVRALRAACAPADRLRSPTARRLGPALAVTAALSLGAARAPAVAPPPTEGHVRESSGRSSSAAPAPCPAGTLSDGDVCVELSDPDDGAPESASAVNAHFDRRGRWVVYDEIPRRPDRPADYDAYRYPIPCDHGCVVSGFDLDRPDEMQRRGRHLSHVGHGAVDLPQKKGTPIRMVPLESQRGDADVVYVGPLFGTTVVTRHSVQEGGRARDYILLFAHLDAPAPGLHAGVHLTEGDLVGFVGDTGSPELVHLHLEARRVRDDEDVTRLPPTGLVANEHTVVCDPRNVLPLR